MLSPEQWAEQTFGQVQLRDMLRIRRAVKAGSRDGTRCHGLSAQATAQLEKCESFVSLARIEADVTFEGLMQPHCQQTREQIDAVLATWSIRLKKLASRSETDIIIISDQALTSFLRKDVTTFAGDMQHLLSGPQEIQK